MASGSFHVGNATNYYFYSGSWGSGNVLTSTTGATYSSWGASGRPVNPTDSIAWIQIYKLNFNTDATYHTASYKGWVGSSSNNTFTDNTDNASNTNSNSYQNINSNVTFGAKTTNTGTFSTYRTNGTAYGTITDSHSNSWNGDMNCILYYYSLPGAPSAPSAVVNSPTSITVSWTAPTDNGGTTITGYRIEYSTNSGSTWTAVSNVSTTESSTATSYSFSANPSTSYRFRISAITDMVTRLRTARSISTASGPFVAMTSNVTTGALTTITFPNVSNLGYSYSSATSIISSNGFTGTASQTTITSGANYSNMATVGSQSVTAGTTSTNPDTRAYSLGVYTSIGTVPTVTGQTQATAVSNIIAAGFQSPTIVTTSVGATSSNNGKVASQSVSGSQSLDTLVTITVYFLSTVGARIDNTGTKISLTTSKRYDGTTWIDTTTAKRYDGTTWIDISNS